jgi:hypothetical protein
MCLVFAVFVAGPASATTLTLDYLIGTVVPASPSDPGDELAYANNLIDWYNAGGGVVDDPSGDGYTYALLSGDDATDAVPPPNLALATGGVQVPAVNDALASPVDVTGYTYLWAKFGNQGALYFLDSLTSVEGFDPAWGPFSQEGGGLSHITLFGPGTTRVPEAGALLLFGSGLIGLVGYRRMRRMQ